MEYCLMQIFVLYDIYHLVESTLFSSSFSNVIFLSAKLIAK